MSSKKSISSVGWSGTQFNIENPPQFNADKLKCLIFQRELCPDTGRQHWQFACRTASRNGLALSTMKLLFPGAHLEPSIGNWEQNVAYCSKKETRFFPDMEPTILGDPPAFGKALGKRKLDHLTPLLEKAMDGKTKLKDIIISDPATYARNYNAIRHIQTLFTATAANKYKPEDFNRDLEKFNASNPVLVFRGESGIGKTAFARAHFKSPLMVNHLDDLRKFDTDFHDGLVFDDMSFNHLPVNFQIQLLDSEYDRSIHLRNVNVTIPAMTKKIFTCNPGREPFTDSDDAIMRRQNPIVDFTGPLFAAPLNQTQVLTPSFSQDDLIDLTSDSQ